MQGTLGSSTGYENVAIGYEALKAFTTGLRNTMIGTNAGDATTTGSRNICIGYNTDAPSATSNDTLNIGNLIKGDLSGAIITTCGAVLPDADGTRNIGSGALRYNTIYATTGAINTSDERHKVIRSGGGLNAAELRAWGNVRAIIYQDAHSVAEWGANAARFHAGYGWDAIKQAFTAEGLDAGRYGLWCADPVLEPQTVTETRQRPVLDEDGQPVFELRPLLLALRRMASTPRPPWPSPCVASQAGTARSRRSRASISTSPPSASLRSSGRQAAERAPSCVGSTA
jgi:hypothetical protein